MECECHTSAFDGFPAIWPVELHQAAQLSKLPFGSLLVGLDQQCYVVNLCNGRQLLHPAHRPLGLASCSTNTGHLHIFWSKCACTLKQTTLNLFIAIPNLLGGLLSAAALLVCFVFPR